MKKTSRGGTAGGHGNNTKHTNLPDGLGQCGPQATEKGPDVDVAQIGEARGDGARVGADRGRARGGAITVGRARGSGGSGSGSGSGRGATR